MLGPQYTYRAELVRIIDGDTFVARVDLGFRIRHDINVRIADVDTPELPSDRGRQATDFLRENMEGEHLLIQSRKDKRSFERWVCDVWVQNKVLGWVSIGDLIAGSDTGQKHVAA
jgi:micrococcal nuclease